MKNPKIVSQVWTFLNSNSPALNSIASIFLSVMAFVVSVKSCEIAERQNKLSEAQLLPHIRVDNDLDYDSSTHQFFNYRLLIFNDEMPISNVEIQFKTFFHIEVVEKGSGITHSGLLPIYGFFYLSSHTNQSTGLLYTITSFDKYANSRAMKLENDFSQSEKLRRKFEFVDIEMRNILSVTYTDKLDRRNTKFFLADGVYGGVEMTKEEFDKYQDQRKLEDRGMLKFNDITVDKLIQAFEKIDETPPY